MEYRLYPIKLFITKVPVLFLFALIVMFNLFSWVWLWLQIPRGVEYVFLHYTVLFGVDRIGGVVDMYMIPLAGIAMGCLNSILGWILYRRSKFFSYILLSSAVLVNIFVAMYAVLVVFLNI